MKKLLFAFTALLMLSCSSSDDDNDGNSSNSDFHPPSWIQGNWSNGIGGFVFKKNDFCTKTSNFEICLAESLAMSKKSGGSVKVDEEISETVYKFSITTQGQTSYYHFIKVTTTKIELINPIQGQPNSPFIKQ